MISSRYRNRMEFKGTLRKGKVRMKHVDIETEWNLKLADESCSAASSAGRYRNRMEFKG